MDRADQIWNRACEGGGNNPRPGDVALSALLGAHGLAMNGGVLHAVECLSASELSGAISGYRHFGFGKVADLLSEARDVLEADKDLGAQEAILDGKYAELIPDDGCLTERFRDYLSQKPGDFAPVRA